MITNVSKQCFRNLLLGCGRFYKVSTRGIFELFYVTLICFSKHKNSGPGWCQTFSIFLFYFTEPLDHGRMLCCFFIQKLKKFICKTCFFFYCRNISDVQIIVNPKIDKTPSKLTLNTAMDSLFCIFSASLSTGLFVVHEGLVGCLPERTFHQKENLNKHCCQSSLYNLKRFIQFNNFFKF